MESEDPSYFEELTMERELEEWHERRYQEKKAAEDKRKNLAGMSLEEIIREFAIPEGKELEAA